MEYNIFICKYKGLIMTVLINSNHTIRTPAAYPQSALVLLLAATPAQKPGFLPPSLWGGWVGLPSPGYPLQSGVYFQRQNINGHLKYIAPATFLSSSNFNVRQVFCFASFKHNIVFTCVVNFLKLLKCSFSIFVLSTIVPV